jgi:2-phospho-L-lactate guanylyltransferase
MSVWAIIPVKPLVRAKSRLASLLSPQERAFLAEKLMRHVIQVTRTAPQINGVLVISRDTRALAIAREEGAHTVQEAGAPELNSALMRATAVLSSWRAEAVLILPADLPFISRDDLIEVLRLGEADHSVVLATDQHQDGTNVMLVRPPGLFPYAYGQNSFARHRALAEAAGARVHVYASQHVALDIDTPSDFDAYCRALGTDRYALFGIAATDSNP